MQFSDVISALRSKRSEGVPLKDTIGHMIPDDRLIDVVRRDVSTNYRPDSADWRDSAAEQQRKMEIKVQETFSLMKRSSKVNKLI